MMTQFELFSEQQLNPIQDIMDVIRQRNVKMECTFLERTETPINTNQGSILYMDKWQCAIWSDGGHVSTQFSLGTGYAGRQPLIPEVLNGLAMDAQCARDTMGINEFMSEYGYEDEDEAYKVMRACLDSHTKMLVLFGGELTERMIYEMEIE